MEKNIKRYRIVGVTRDKTAYEYHWLTNKFMPSQTTYFNYLCCINEPIKKMSMNDFLEHPHLTEIRSCAIDVLKGLAATSQLSGFSYVEIHEVTASFLPATNIKTSTVIFTIAFWDCWNKQINYPKILAEPPHATARKIPYKRM